MVVQDILRFDLFPSFENYRITEWYFNKTLMIFEFKIANQEATIKCPSVVNDKGKPKTPKEMLKDIQDSLSVVIDFNKDDNAKGSFCDQIEEQIQANLDAISKVVNGNDNGTDNTQAEKSAATILVKLAMENIKKLFKDQYGYAFAVIHNEDHDELLKLTTKNEKCNLYLGRLFYRTQGKTANAESISNAIHTLQADAVFGTEQLSLDVRVAWSSPKREEIHYDMTDSQWRRIIITSQGWKISNNINPILFVRFNQSPQIEPDKNYPADIFDQFLDLMHIEGANNRLLAKTWIISLLVPDIPHVIDLVFGTQGGAKSTFYKYIKRLVDPDRIELLSIPTQMAQFAQQMYHNHLVVYDNVKHIAKWFCDELCKASTGIGISKRTLYSDDDDTIYQYKRCIVVNGINNVVVEPDALDRSIQMEHKRIKDEDMKEDAEVTAKFDNLRPKLFAYILDILVKALVIKPQIKKITGGGSMRMADFVYWSEAISRAMGEEPLALAKAYWENIGKQNAEIIENHDLAQAIIKFVDAQGEVRDNLVWSGRMSVFMKDLEEVAMKNKILTDENRKDWPKRVEDLTKSLRPVIPNLKSTFGIIVDIFKKTNGKDKGISYIEIRKDPSYKPPLESDTITPLPSPSLSPIPPGDLPVLKAASPASPASLSVKTDQNLQEKVQENSSFGQSEANTCCASQSEANMRSEANQPYQGKMALPENPEIRAQISTSKASEASKANLQNGGTTTPLDNDPTQVLLPRNVEAEIPVTTSILDEKLQVLTVQPLSPIRLAELQGNFAAIDLEWNPLPNGQGRHEIYTIAIYDDQGQKIVKDVSMFENTVENSAEKQLLEWFLREIYGKYDTTIGFCTTEIQNPKTGRGINSDFVILDKALCAYGIPSIIEFPVKDNKPQRPYIRDKKHFDLFPAFSLEITNGIFGGVYNGNSLEDIAEGLLNKTIVGSGSEINDMSIEDRIKHVLQDVELTYELVAYDNFKLLTILNSIANIIKLPLVDICYSTIGNWWGKMIVDKGYDSILRPHKIDKKDYPGGRVIEPITGMYKKPVFVFDVSSLYPTMMINHKLSPETVNCDCCVENPDAYVPQEVMDMINNWLKSPLNTKKYSDEEERDLHYWICRKQAGAVPQLLKDLRTLKKKYKEEGNEAMEYAVKILINGFYGLFGEEHFPYSNFEVAELTSTFGKLTLQKMEDLAQKHKLTIIYGDTDSLFVTDIKSEEQLNQFKQEWASLYPDIEISSEEYRQLLLLEKKMYIAWPAKSTKKNPNMKPLVKGIQGSKSNEPKLFNEIQKMIVETLGDASGNGNGRDNLIQKLRKIYNDLVTDKLDCKLLRRRIELGNDPREYMDDLVQKIIGIAENKQKGQTIWYYNIGKGNAKEQKIFKALSYEERTKRYQNPDLICKAKYIEDLKRTFDKQLKNIPIDFNDDIIVGS